MNHRKIYDSVFDAVVTFVIIHVTVKNVEGNLLPFESVLKYKKPNIK